jgi:rubrerythrin
MGIFNIHDIIEFAIRIEEDGEAFYRDAAERAGYESARQLFLGLADAEIGHKKTFQSIRDGLGDYQPAETYDGEYGAYLRNYIDGKVVFGRDKGSRSGLDLAGAIDFAIGRELDSILYYQEVKRFVPEHEHAMVDKIIEEERRHFLRLSEMKESL